MNRWHRCVCVCVWLSEREGEIENPNLCCVVYFATGARCKDLDTGNIETTQEQGTVF